MNGCAVCACIESTTKRSCYVIARVSPGNASGSTTLSGARRGTACRARTGRPRAPGGGGARQTVPGGVACALRGASGHGMPCPYGSPALPGGWRGTADRARRGRPRALGGGGARHAVRGGVARAIRGVAGHGMPCPEGLPVLPGARRGTADRARRGRLHSPGRGGARQTVRGGVARAPRGASGHGRPCPYGSPALPGGWRGTADRARRGRLRALGRGGARQTVPGGVACTPRGVVGHGRPCPEGSPALPEGVLFQRSTLHNLCYTISRQTTLPPGFLLIDC